MAPPQGLEVIYTTGTTAMPPSTPTTADWRSIPGFRGRYEINRKGDVRSYAIRGTNRLAKTPSLLKRKAGKSAAVSLRGKTFSIQGLLAQTFGA